MSDADPASVEAMYSAASQCLHEKKNRRPDIAKVFTSESTYTARGVVPYPLLSIHFKTSA